MHWSLGDVVDCVSREVQRREADYPTEVQEGRLPVEQAQQELGQMKAALSSLTVMREQGQDARQGTLF